MELDKSPSWPGLKLSGLDRHARIDYAISEYEHWLEEMAWVVAVRAKYREAPRSVVVSSEQWSEGWRGWLFTGMDLLSRGVKVELFQGFEHLGREHLCRVATAMQLPVDTSFEGIQEAITEWKAQFWEVHNGQ